MIKTDRLKVTQELHHKTKLGAIEMNITIPQYQAHLLNMKEEIPKIAKELQEIEDKSNDKISKEKMKQLREKLNNIIEG